MNFNCFCPSSHWHFDCIQSAAKWQSNILTATSGTSFWSLGLNVPSLGCVLAFVWEQEMGQNVPFQHGGFMVVPVLPQRIGNFGGRKCLFLVKLLMIRIVSAELTDDKSFGRASGDTT